MNTNSLINKPKVLVIPSWYPTKVEPFFGKVFQDQAAMLLSEFDMRVLYGDRTKLNKTSWLKKRGLSYTSPLEKAITPQGLAEYRFEYLSWCNHEKWLIHTMINGYRLMLTSLINEGWKPDLIHAQCTNPMGIVAMVLRKVFGIPYVLTEHQVFALGNYSKYRAKLMAQAIRKANIMTVTSQHQIRCLATHYLYPKLMISNNLIDEEIFKCIHPQKKDDKFRILTLQWPDKIKDPETLFHAIACMLQQGHQNIEVVVIGKKIFTDSDTSPFRLLAEKYNVQDVCKFIPSVSQDDLVRSYAEANVFVSTSVAETFGLAVREAMAVGRPVVCTASGGVDDDIFEFNGFKVNIYDYKGVAKALIAIKTGDVKYDPTRISEYVVSKYGRKAFLTQWTEIYNDAISKS